MEPLRWVIISVFAEEPESFELVQHFHIFPPISACCLETPYLLNSAEHRDATTWGTYLLEKEKLQNLHLEISVNDGGLGLRKGVKEAFPDADETGGVCCSPLCEEQEANFSSHKKVFLIFS